MTSAMMIDPDGGGGGGPHGQRVQLSPGSWNDYVRIHSPEIPTVDYQHVITLCSC